MGVLNEAQERQLKNFLSLKEDDWVEWMAQPNDFHDACDKFNGCYFIVKHMPEYPQHVNCQCRLVKTAKPTPNVTAKATCDIRKFRGYVFSEENNKGKKRLFESWGYTIEDSEYLQRVYISQAIQKYCSGEYKYAGVNKQTAKISITITLKNRNGVEQHINTIWKIIPGEIELVTPYSGHSYSGGKS